MAAARSLSSLAVKSPWKLKLPGRLKGGRLEKWGDYWTTVAHDYKEVMIDTVVESKKHPVKTSAYLSLIAGVVYAVKTNPNEMDYQDTLVAYRNESAMLSDKVRNPEVDAHLQYMGDCFDHGLTRRLSLGLFSFLWIDNYSKACGVFKSQCGYLKPRYVTFHERIQDVGFLGRWWRIEQLMEEFDVNHKELPDQGEPGATQKLKLLWKSAMETVSQVRNIL